MRHSGDGVGFAYAAQRNGRRVLGLHPAPRLDGALLDVAQIVPAQLPRRFTVHTSGTRALLGRLHALALCDAGWPLDGRRAPAVPTQHLMRWQTRRTLGTRWLCGELDDQVAVPIGWVCDQLAIDAAAPQPCGARPADAPATRHRARRRGV